MEPAHTRTHDLVPFEGKVADTQAIILFHCHLGFPEKQTAQKALETQ